MFRRARRWSERATYLLRNSNIFDLWITLCFPGPGEAEAHGLLLSAKDKGEQHEIREDARLAVVAATALMAFVGAGGASATVLCTTTPTNKDCPKGEDYAAGTQIIASAKTSVVLEDTEGNTVTTCAGGSLKGKTTNTGSATETVDGPNEELVWSNCKASVVTNELGSFEIHADEKHNGVVTGKVIGITLVTPLFVSCVYGSGSSAPLGTIASGETRRSTSTPHLV